MTHTVTHCYQSQSSHKKHFPAQIPSFSSPVVCRKYSFQQICRAIFWSLTQADGCRFLAAKAVLLGVECGSELYYFLSQGLPLALCIAPTSHAMSGANITVMVDWALNTKLLTCQSPYSSQSLLIHTKVPRFCDKLLHTTGRSVSPGSPVSFGLVNCNTEWTRVVRDVSCALCHTMDHSAESVPELLWL